MRVERTFTPFELFAFGHGGPACLEFVIRRELRKAGFNLSKPIQVLCSNWNVSITYRQNYGEDREAGIKDKLESFKEEQRKRIEK